VAGIGQFGAWRHAVVGLTIVGGSALTLAGIIGKPDEPAKFDAKQVVIAPNGAGGMTVREVIDQDFGDADHHGYEQTIDDDFGPPTDITAESPDADADVHVSQTTGSGGGPATQIRLGDPAVTVTGQHRYILTYTLPSVTLPNGQLFYDVVNPGLDPVTDHFEAVVTGYVLADPGCATGDAHAAVGTCVLAESGNTYRATLDPLPAGDGLTISGTVTTTRDLADVPIPALPPRRSESSTVPLGLAMIPLGLAGGGAVFELARRRGRNEVYAGGAADAAFGPTGARPGAPLPPPGRTRQAPARTRLVPDSEMARLATIEFVPPTGVAPWQGNVLLRERIDDDTVSAWFSGLAGRDVLTISKGGDDGDTVVVGKGPKYATADPGDAPVLAQLFADGDTVELDGYDQGFATAWRSARAEVDRTIATSGWWKRLPPSGGGGCAGRMSVPVLIFGAVWLFILGGSLLTALLGVFSGPIGAIIFGIAVPAVAAFAVYHSMLPARSAEGSALALRTESFRRFLAASEGRHVEWAWKQGVLREYSAWAVALGTADTWQRAMASTSIPPAELRTGPLLLWTMAPSFHSGFTPPSSSGGGGGGSWGGGGGGFSGGVGGGGGGSSSGSW
jgi:uncharacterized membrane protein YgcG